MKYQEEFKLYVDEYHAAKVRVSDNSGEILPEYRTLPPGYAGVVVGMVTFITSKIVAILPDGDPNEVVFFWHEVKEFI